MILHLKEDVQNNTVACSECFCDHGLQLTAINIGIEDNEICPNCKSTDGKKLSLNQLEEVAYHFFVYGSFIFCDYGAFPEIQFNNYQETSITINDNLKKDIRIFEESLGIGFFYYGPRAWMYGDIEPLNDLLDPDKRNKVIKRIIQEYPNVTITQNDSPLYRIRKGENLTNNSKYFDSPPDQFLGSGRLDSKGFPVLYTSPDLELCIHEMRAALEDELYVATLIPEGSLNFLDLSIILKENESFTDFESLDIAVNMLFLAGKHAYEITHEISLAAKNAGFDGIVYPSYFSNARKGLMPHQALVYGISNRRIPQFQSIEHSKVAQNIAIFGRPILEGKVKVHSINKLMLTKVSYNYLLGAVNEEE